MQVNQNQNTVAERN